MSNLTFEDFQAALSSLVLFPPEERSRALMIGEKLATDEERGTFFMEISAVHERLSAHQKDMEQALEEMKSLVQVAEHSVRTFHRKEEEETSRSEEMQTMERKLSGTSFA